MFEIVTAGGWLMIPIIACSVVALGISVERFLALKPEKVAPDHLLASVWHALKTKKLDGKKLSELKSSSPLGRILAAGLSNSRHGRDVMKESIQEAAAHVIHDLERYLNPAWYHCCYRTFTRFVGYCYRYD